MNHSLHVRGMLLRWVAWCIHEVRYGPVGFRIRVYVMMATHQPAPGAKRCR